MKRNFLILALSSKAWGETHFALHMAAEMEKRGDGAFLIIRPHSEPLLKNSPMAYAVVDHSGPPLGPPLGPAVEHCLARHDPSAIILADYFCCAQFLKIAGCAPSFLLEGKVPLVALDTWDSARSGFRKDYFCQAPYDVPDWIRKIRHRLLPVPFIAPKSGRGLCSFLAEESLREAPLRGHFREKAGLGKEDRIVLFCTAQWQYPVQGDPDGERLSESVPHLLAHYLERLGKKVHLVHVGPVPLPRFRVLGDRYHWLGQVAPRPFMGVMRDADLVLSLNAAATTNMTAFSEHIPVVLLHNSVAAEALDAALSSVGSGTTGFLRQWIRRALPLYGFHVWPLGLHDFMNPVLTGNPYVQALAWLELLEEEAVLTALSALLFRKNARDEQVARQDRYADLVRKLPSPMAVIETALK